MNRKDLIVNSIIVVMALGAMGWVFAFAAQGSAKSKQYDIKQRERAQAEATPGKPFIGEQVKMFPGAEDADRLSNKNIANLEKHINTWLQSQKDIEVVRVQQSSSEFQAIITIWYKTK